VSQLRGARECHCAHGRMELGNVAKLLRFGELFLAQDLVVFLFMVDGRGPAVSRDDDGVAW
jgi:hypothetical protein